MAPEHVCDTSCLHPVRSYKLYAHGRLEPESPMKPVGRVPPGLFARECSSVKRAPQAAHDHD
eukprot:6891923-Pyramimonas_sp.AAC.1